MLEIMQHQACIREIQQQAEKEQAKRNWLRRGKR